MEKDMKHIAEAMGIELFCFIIDFTAPNGEDRHISVQAIGTNLASAAKGALEYIEADDNIVSSIVYCPGSYTLDELEDLATNKTTASFRPLYVRALRDKRSTC